jgi:hypothetical protein
VVPAAAADPAGVSQRALLCVHLLLLLLLLLQEVRLNYLLYCPTLWVLQIRLPLPVNLLLLC